MTVTSPDGLSQDDHAQYNDKARLYTSYADLPVAQLEAELIRNALGDCTGLAVLDLGGGTGSYARMAASAGARLVDVVDISPTMLSLGKAATSPAKTSCRIRWLLGDVTQPLTDQPLATDLLSAGGYDIAMANWLFDHAHSERELEAMWANVASALRPGGRFIGIRAVAPGIWADHNVVLGKYGCLRSDIRLIPGGIACMATLLTNPPLCVGVTLMEDAYTLRDDIGKKMGMKDFATVPEDTEVVRRDPSFWKDHLEEPEFAVVTATKA